MKNRKTEPWRILLGAASVVYILSMWIKKDVASLYAAMPREQVLPLLVTTVAVSLGKVIVLAGILLLLKWMLGKLKK